MEAHKELAPATLGPRSARNASAAGQVGILYMRWQLPDSGAQLMSSALREQTRFVLLHRLRHCRSIKRRTFCAKAPMLPLKSSAPPNDQIKVKHWCSH